MRQMQDTKQEKRNLTLPTNLLSSFGWAYRYLVRVPTRLLPTIISRPSGKTVDESEIRLLDGQEPESQDF